MGDFEIQTCCCLKLLCSLLAAGLAPYLPQGPGRNTTGLGLGCGSVCAAMPGVREGLGWGCSVAWPSFKTHFGHLETGDVQVLLKTRYIRVQEQST